MNRKAVRKESGVCSFIVKYSRAGSTKATYKPRELFGTLTVVVASPENQLLLFAPTLYDSDKSLDVWILGLLKRRW